MPKQEFHIAPLEKDSHGLSSDHLEYSKPADARSINSESILQSFLRSGPTELSCLSGQIRNVAGVFRPTTTTEVAAVVQAAAASGRVRLCPFSCGKNWGFGSNLPVADKVYLMDLSQMQRVRKLDLTTGCIEIEPGITQGALDDLLRKNGRTHYFNVTGAGRATSVLGNALERGIGYFGSKNEDLLDLEVVLGDGTVIRTRGIQQNSYHTGLGPDLTGLFVQSSFGIVTAAKLRLRKRPECMAAMLIQPLPAALAKVVDCLGALRQEDVFTGVPHMGNRQRIITTFGPHLPPGMLEAFKASAPEWSCALALTGGKDVVQANFDYICRRLEGMAMCRLISPDSGAVDPVYANLVDLVQGIPNDFALPSVAFSAFSEGSAKMEDLDAGRAGLIQIAPTCAASGSEIRAALEVIEVARKEAGIGELPMTLNLVNPGMIAIIISIPFQKENGGSQAGAKRLSGILLSRFSEKGCLPYRLSLEDSRFLPDPAPGRALALRSIKKACDGNNILGPSKYDYNWHESTFEPESLT